MHPLLGRAVHHAPGFCWLMVQLLLDDDLELAGMYRSLVEASFTGKLQV